MLASPLQPLPSLERNSVGYLEPVDYPEDSVLLVMLALLLAVAHSVDQWAPHKVRGGGAGVLVEGLCGRSRSATVPCLTQRASMMLA